MFLFHWNGLSKFFKHGILDVQIINRLYSLHYCTSLETSSHHIAVPFIYLTVPLIDLTPL